MTVGTTQLTVIRDGIHTTLDVPIGSNLRETLLTHELTPYAWVARQLNCGGRGLCATCGVEVQAGETAPEHWHDKLAKRFRYPRLSCQITVDAPMTVRIMTEKRIWGDRLKQESS